MTAAIIVDGPVAGNTANLGAAALHGKLAGVGQIGGASVTGSASKTAAGPGSLVGIASPGSGGAPFSGSSAVEPRASWKEEFQDQATRLAEANDASNPMDLNEFSLPADAPVLASSVTPGSLALQEGMLAVSFPVEGQASSRGKTGGLQPGLAGTSSGRAGGNGSSLASSPIPALTAPASAFSASRIGASQQSSSSTRTSHGSGLLHTSNSHSVSSALTSPPALLSATASLPVASPVLTILPMPVPVAGNGGTGQSPAMGSRAVSGVGSLVESGAFQTASGVVSGNRTGTSGEAIRSGIGPQGKPLEQASLGPNGAIVPLSGSALGERIPGRLAFDSPTSIGKVRFSGIDLSIAGAQQATARETISSPPASLDPRRSAPQQASLSASVHGSNAAMSSAPVQPNAQALLQLAGVVSATVAGDPREASVRSASSVPRGPVSEDPVSSIDSGGVLARAAHAEAPSAVGASAGPATNPGGVRLPGADALLAVPLQHPSAVGTAALPLAPGVSGDHAAIFASASNAERLTGPVQADFLAKDAINASITSSASVYAKESPTKAASSIGKRDSGFARDASLHTSGSTPGSASFSHSGPAETGVAVAGGIASAIRQGAPTGSAGTSGNSPGSPEIFDLMDQAPVQVTGRDGRVVVASSAAGAARELQVGYQDPVLGYVELRAHSSVNGVHASLEAQSATAGDTLSGQLSALTGWMDERRTPLESLTVSTLTAQPDSGLAQHGRDSAASGQDGGASAGYGGGDGGQSGFFHSAQAPPLRTEFGLAATQPLAQHGSAGSLTGVALPGGSSFSVMA